jgi:cyclophilin family peptidyl-prolyl cis-trans isomerase
MKKFFKILLIFSVLMFTFLSCSKKTTKTKKEENLLKITNKVILKTSLGDITVGLYGNAMPLTVKNFLNYVNSGFYNGLIFHRIIPNFVIQGGGLDKNMIKKQTKPPIKLENPPYIEKTIKINGKEKKEKVLSLTHQKYMLSMARMMAPNTATSQFFITLAKVPHLDPKPLGHSNGYAVFGKVLKGFDVVDKIAKTKTTTIKGRQNVPIEPIFIKKAYELKRNINNEK